MLISPGPDRGLALLTRGGAVLIGAAALVLGGFSVGGNVWLASPGGFTRDLGSEVTGLPGDLLIAAVLVAVAVGCLRAPVSRRVLALLAIPVIPYAVLWQEKLASDLFGQAGGASASVSVLAAPALPAAAAAGGRHRRRDLARPAPRHPAGQSGFPHRAEERRERLARKTWWWWRRPPPSLAPPPPPLYTRDRKLSPRFFPR